MPERHYKAAAFTQSPGGHDSFSAQAGSEALAYSAGDAHLSSALIEQARILALLHDIGKELTSILDFEALLRAVGERVKRLVDYDLFSVMLLNPETRRLEHALSLCYDERIQLRATLALGEGLCGTAALERQPIRVDRVEFDPRYIRCEGSPLVESELVIPLIVKDRLLGVLDLESIEPCAFTEDHEQMLATLASTVAIALENARLYDQLRRAEQRRTEDLERAREVQQLLLPKEMPRLHGIDIAVLYLPAQELGGDFYDLLPYGEGRLAIAVGDVAGKGPAAALLASLGVGILREHAVHSPSLPAEMLADLNGHLQMPGSNGQFIAMAFGVYDGVRRELCLANAGFPQPFLVRDNRVETVDVAGVPLGLLPDSTYESVCLRLQPGDFVVFCSDGIHEQTNALDEEFGLRRLIAQLGEACASFTAERIAGDIVKAIEVHAGKDGPRSQPRDDRTIVVLRIGAGPR
ncbi:MAG: SpoIIE family protein phosphatase [Acidobacteriia bacterium]|nr:SpoIIE family protein phosphatase [Terriglobia bacterium]